MDKHLRGNFAADEEKFILQGGIFSVPPLFYSLHVGGKRLMPRKKILGNGTFCLFYYKSRS